MTLPQLHWRSLHSFHFQVSYPKLSRPAIFFGFRLLLWPHLFLRVSNEAPYIPVAILYQAVTIETISVPIALLLPFEANRIISPLFALLTHADHHRLCHSSKFHQLSDG